MPVPSRNIQPLRFNTESVNYQNIIIYDVVLCMGEALKHKLLPPWGVWTFLFDVGVSGYGLALSNRAIEPHASYPFILKALLARRFFILAGEGMSCFGQEGINVLDKMVWATLFVEMASSIYFTCQMSFNAISDQRTFGVTPRS